MKVETILTEKGTCIKFEGQSSALHPFELIGVNNASLLQDFFCWVISTNEGKAQYLKLTSGENQTKFVIKAQTNEHGNLEFSASPDYEYNAAHKSCMKDYIELQKAIRKVAVSGFSLTEGSFGDWTNQVHTIIKREGDQTIIIGERDNIPFLDTTKALIES